MMTSGSMTPQGSDLSQSFRARGNDRRVDPTVARRRSLTAAERHVGDTTFRSGIA